jgi:hypothetical protein
MTTREFNKVLEDTFGDKYQPLEMSDPLQNTPTGTGIGFIDENGTRLYSPYNTIYPYPDAEVFYFRKPWNSPIYDMTLLGIRPYINTDVDGMGMIMVFELDNKPQFMANNASLESDSCIVNLKEIVLASGINWYSGDGKHFESLEECIKYEKTIPPESIRKEYR